MKILFITSTFPTPVRPQQGTFNQTLVRALSARHDVRVVAPIPWPQYATSAPVASWRQDMTGVPVWHPIYCYAPKVLRRYLDLFYWQSIQPTVKAIQQQWTPDLVVGYWLHPDGAAATAASQLLGVPGVLISGGSDLKCLPQAASRRKAIQEVLRDADRLIVVSRDLARRAESLGAEAAKIEVIYRGVDEQCFYPISRQEARAACGLREDAVVVFWAGRFEKVKNPVILLHAAVHWKKKWGDRLCVLIAGDGAMRNQLVRLRRRLGLETCVRFEGALPQADLRLRYNAADVTALTSHSEGVPNVLLESIACDVPFVATDVGGVSEIATPGVDRLVLDGDVQRLVEAVSWRVQAPRGEAATRQRRMFVPATMREVAEQFERAFEGVLERSRCRQPLQSRLVLETSTLGACQKVPQ